MAGLTRIEFFDSNNNSIFSRNALITVNQELSFLGAVANAGERIRRVRITSGLNTIVSNGMLGNSNDDVVVMDDFLYAEPAAVPEPMSLTLTGLGLASIGIAARRRSRRRATGSAAGR